MAQAMMGKPQTTQTFSRNFQKASQNSYGDAELHRKSKIINKINKSLKWGRNGFQLRGKTYTIDELTEFLRNFYRKKRFHLKPAFIMGTSKDEYWKISGNGGHVKQKKIDRVTVTLNKLNDSFVMTDKGFTFGEKDYDTIDELRSFLQKMNEKVGVSLKLGLVEETSGDNISEDSSTEQSSIGETTSDDNSESSDEENHFDKKLNNISGEFSRFSCSIYDKDFKSKNYLSAHTRRVHSDTKHNCKNCGRKFTRKDTLNEHMSSFHPHDK